MRLRKRTLATTALGAILMLPAAAMAQESCIEVLATADAEVQAADLSPETEAEANALITNARNAADTGDEAGCVENLHDLRAMLGDAGQDLEALLSRIEPAADAEANVDVESDAEIAAEIGTDPDEQIETDIGTDMDASAEAGPGNAYDMLADNVAGDVEGADILSPDGEDIGTVEFLVVDPDGEVQAVVSLDDGILGIGDSERVVSLDRLDYDTEDGDFWLTGMSQEWLEGLPEYDSDTEGYARITAESAIHME